MDDISLNGQFPTKLVTTILHSSIIARGIIGTVNLQPIIIRFLAQVPHLGNFLSKFLVIKMANKYLQLNNNSLVFFKFYLNLYLRPASGKCSGSIPKLTKSTIASSSCHGILIRIPRATAY